MPEVDQLTVRIDVNTEPLERALKQVNFADFSRRASDALSEIDDGLSGLRKSIDDISDKTNTLPTALRKVGGAAGKLKTALGFISGPLAIVSGITTVIGLIGDLAGIHDTAAEAAGRHSGRLDELRESAKQAAKRISELTGAAREDAVLNLLRDEKDASAQIEELVPRLQGRARGLQLLVPIGALMPQGRTELIEAAKVIEALSKDPQSLNPEDVRSVIVELKKLSLKSTDESRIEDLDKLVGDLEQVLSATQIVSKSRETRETLKNFGKAPLPGPSADADPSSPAEASTGAVPSFSVQSAGALDETLRLIRDALNNLSEAISTLGACCGNLGAPKVEAREPAAAVTAPSTPVGRSLAAVKEKTGVLEGALVQVSANVDAAFKQSFENIFKTGKFNFGRLKDAAIGSLNSILDNLVGQFTDGLFGSLFGGGTGGGGLFAGILGGVGKLFGFAGGGAVQPGGPVLVGERGPEIFVPKTVGSIVPNSGIGRGGQPVIVNMTNRFDVGLESVDSRIAQAAAPIAAQAVAAIEEARERDFR